jgi:hypothetical protein
MATHSYGYNHQGVIQSVQSTSDEEEKERRRYLCSVSKTTKKEGTGAEAAGKER